MSNSPVTLKMILPQDFADEERQVQKGSMEKLRSLCTEYDMLRAEARKKITDLIKIPFAPAAIVAGAASTLAGFGVIEKKWGAMAVVADIVWALWKLIRSIDSRNMALEKAEDVILEVRMLLSRIDERETLIARSLVDNSQEGLAYAVSALGKPERTPVDS